MGAGRRQCSRHAATAAEEHHYGEGTNGKDLKDNHAWGKTVGASILQPNSSQRMEVVRVK